MRVKSDINGQKIVVVFIKKNLSLLPPFFLIENEN